MGWIRIEEASAIADGCYKLMRDTEEGVTGLSFRAEVLFVLKELCLAWLGVERRSASTVSSYWISFLGLTALHDRALIRVVPARLGADNRAMRSHMTTISLVG